MMRPVILFLKIFGYLWVALAILLVIAGLRPFNVANYVFTLVSFAPGFGAFFLAGWLEERSSGKHRDNGDRVLKGIGRYYTEITAVILLFLFALGIRLLYQNESTVDNPLRADAGKYFSASYNLRQFGVYSLEPPARAGVFAPQYHVIRDKNKLQRLKNLDIYSMKPRREGQAPPASRTDLCPGYPAFLSIFWRANNTKSTFDFLLTRVLRAQAVMGALTVVLTFVTARLCLSFPWAVLAGALTAISPHLVVMDGYILTESLFTFVMVLGTLMLLLSWIRKNGVLAMVAGVLLAFSAHVRAINILFLFCLGSVYFLSAQNRSFSLKSIGIKQMLFLLLGFAVVTGAFRVFRYQMVTDGGTREAPQHYIVLEDRLSSGLKSFSPPRPPAKGDDLPDGLSSNSTFTDRFLKRPVSYVTWNLRRLMNVFVIWCWHNKYLDDIYIYPMKRGGFHVNLFLTWIYTGMRFVHWPLYLLTLCAPIMFFVRWRKGTMAVESRTLLVPVLGFMYFPLVLMLLSSNLPRYAIGARPFSYILAVASLSWLVQRHVRPSKL